MTQLHSDDTEPANISYGDENPFLREMWLDATDVSRAQRCSSCKHFICEATGDGYNEPMEFNDSCGVGLWEYDVNLSPSECDRFEPAPPELINPEETALFDDIEF